MRYTVTVPAAGKITVLPITGRSIIIESAAVFETPEDVPLIAFRPGQNQYPVYPRSIYSNNEQPFDSVVIEGTEESEGTEVTIFATPDCLKTSININVSETIRAKCGETFMVAASDAAQQFTQMQLMDDDQNLPSVIYISCAPLTASERGIKYAFDTDPDQGKETKGHYLGEEVVEIRGIDFILKFSFIAETAGETPGLNVTCEY